MVISQRGALFARYDAHLQPAALIGDRLYVEQIVRRLEAGQVKLDDAIQSYERGAQLKRHCEQKLAEAQQRVDRIVIGPDGEVGAAPAKLD